MLGFAVPFASLSENAGQNYFAESNPWCFHFSSSNFSLQDHTVSTAGNTASPVVLSMWPCKYIFHIQFSFFSFCNPTHKTETRTAMQTGGTLLITTHLDQSLWWANEKYWPSDHIYYTLFCRCTVLLRPLPATPNCAIMLSQNHFPTGMFWLFLHPKLLCRSHTFSTGDALRCSCKASERENQ